MSSFSIFKTSIGNINSQLLKEAVEEVARMHGYTVVKSVTDYYGQHHSCVTGLKDNAECPRGIGFDVDANGNLIAEGDSYEFSQGFRQIQNQVEQMIKARKIMQSARQMYPQAKMRTAQQNKDLILVVET